MCNAGRTGSAHQCWRMCGRSGSCTGDAAQQAEAPRPHARIGTWSRTGSCRGRTTCGTAPSCITPSCPDSQKLHHACGACGACHVGHSMCGPPLPPLHCSRLCPCPHWRWRWRQRRKWPRGAQRPGAHAFRVSDRGGASMQLGAATLARMTGLPPLRTGPGTVEAPLATPSFLHLRLPSTPAPRPLPSLALALALALARARALALAATEPEPSQVSMLREKRSRAHGAA